jgi:dTDP-4-dehydrorhamnose 3,5-epimerase
MMGRPNPRMGLHEPRPGLPTAGQYESVIASDRNRLQPWASASVARGFCTLSEFAEVENLTTWTYDPSAESRVRLDGSRIGISRPVSGPPRARRDAEAQSLDDWLRRPEAEAFRFGA